MLVLDELQYCEDHVWVRYEENHTVTLGITDFAQLKTIFSHVLGCDAGRLSAFLVSRVREERLGHSVT